MNQELREKVAKAVHHGVYKFHIMHDSEAYKVADAILALFASSLVKAQREAFCKGWRAFCPSGPEAQAKEEYPDAALTAHTEAGEWLGPVRCNKCSKVYATAPSVHYWSWNKHPYPRELCDGTFVPYERRKGGA